MVTDAPLSNGTPAEMPESGGTDNSGHRRNSTEPDPQALVIESLRSQVQDLFSQVTQLNNKLVQSYDRVSMLEDDLHIASSNIRSSSLKISQLELERSQHLSALNTGLLVEKSQVTAELTRLMEKATEEASQRGQAENARADIEKDLDDLSASLFSQANAMVAEARLARAISERKVEHAELALKGAEDAVATMQQKLQTLQEEKEVSDRQAEDMRIIMGKGKWVQRNTLNGASVSVPRLFSSHLPYQEFLLFVAHLRSIHLSSPTPPAMSTLLPLPFLARLLTEDSYVFLSSLFFVQMLTSLCLYLSDPTVRLDLAPSLNWLSRRSVLAAIHNSQLIIEPVSTTTLMNELMSPSSSSFTIPTTSNTLPIIPCALCGIPIFPDIQSNQPAHTRSISHPLTLSRSWSSTGSHSSTASWSTSSIFKSYTPTSLSVHSQLTPSSQSRGSSQALPIQQVHIFRLSVTSTPTQAVSVPASRPLTTSTSPSYSQSTSKHISPQPTQSRSQSTVYPLCANGWCLTRLRATCSLWAFIRTGVVDKVWEEEVPTPPAPAPSTLNGRGKDTKANKAASDKPPVPPRRRGLWSMASVLSERAASWGEGDKSKEKNKDKTPLPPPPSHPSAKHTHSPPSAVPPPLPKRSEGRGRNLPPEHTPAVIPAQPPPVNGATKVDEPRKSDEEASDLNLERPSIPTNDSTSPIPVAESDDGFATPTEDLASVSEQASPPRPVADVSTTQQVPELHPESPTPPPPPPLPTPQVAATVVESLPTASPAPPPLPRRAAARNRGAPSYISPPGPHATTTVAAAQTSPPAVVETEQAAADSSTGAPAAPSSAQPEAPTEGNPSTVPIPSELASAPDVAPGGESSETSNSQDGIGGNRGDEVLAPESQQQPMPTIAVSNEHTADSANGVVSETRGEAHVNESDRENAKGDNVENENTEVYIGDATWEERTWKELVKMRETLFWARVGCLR
jgi:Rab guanine nucleotide exchange factor SEC2